MHFDGSEHRSFLTSDLLVFVEKGRQVVLWISTSCATVGLCVERLSLLPFPFPCFVGS